MTTRAKDEVTVDVPVNLAYNQWTQFEEFPEFMAGVVSVEQVTDSRLTPAISATQCSRRSSSCSTCWTPPMNFGNSSNCVHWL